VTPTTGATTGVPQLTIGIDLGDKHSHVCVLDTEGTIVEESRLQTNPTTADDVTSSRSRTTKRCLTITAFSGKEPEAASRTTRGPPRHDPPRAEPRQVAPLAALDSRSTRHSSRRNAMVRACSRFTSPANRSRRKRSGAMGSGIGAGTVFVRRVAVRRAGHRHPREFAFIRPSGEPLPLGGADLSAPR